MALCKFNFSSKAIIIFINSIIWDINFRTTFKNIDEHMDLGSYSSLKYNPKIILIKNICCSLFMIFFFIEIKLGKLKKKKDIKLVKKQEKDVITIEQQYEVSREGIFNSIYISHRINTKRKKTVFFIKIFFIIIFIYAIEECYFIICNNHMLERIICPIRNLMIIISLLIFYPLMYKKCYVLYRHQSIPLIIIIILFLFVLVLTYFESVRFHKIFNLINVITYSTIFILTGLETILIKYLTDKEFLNIFLIIGLKGIIGTVVFFVINYFYNEINFFYLIDKLITFEYENMYETFDLYQKILYIITQIIVQFLKIYIINQFTETHFFYSMMITDIIYFPLYISERIYIQKFEIHIYSLFFSNFIIAITSFILNLIINEILECNCCNFNFNLRKTIVERQIYETQRRYNPIN